jgi:hypothetical protein
LTITLDTDTIPSARITVGLEEMSTQSLALIVYMQGRTLVGTVSIPEGTRLSDYLNDKPRAQGEFLTLKDVTIKLIDGTKETSKTAYINKKSIQMVATLDSDSVRGIGAKEGPKQYPFVQKRPVRATVHLPGYELSGYLYCTEARGVTDLFTEEVTFLPCTDTMIYDVNGGSRLKTDFATINKNHVSCFEEGDLLP